MHKNKVIRYKTSCDQKGQLFFSSSQMHEELRKRGIKLLFKLQSFLQQPLSFL